MPGTGAAPNPDGRGAVEFDVDGGTPGMLGLQPMTPSDAPTNASCTDRLDFDFGRVLDSRESMAVNPLSRTSGKGQFNLCTNVNHQIKFVKPVQQD